MFGFELDFSKETAAFWRQKLDLAMIVVAFMILGLFLRVVTGQKATWYAILEKFIGAAYMGGALLASLILPYSHKGLLLFLGYWLYEAALFAFLPCKIYDGIPLRRYGKEDSTYSLKYKCNGLKAFILTLITFAGGHYLGFWKMSIIHDNFAEILNAVNLVTYAMCFYLFFRGYFVKDAVFTGNALEDFWYGRELNPHIFGGSFDLKFFSEGRVGLIGWVLINLSLATAQYERTGTVTLPMILVNVFHFIYVLDYFVVEHYIVSTIDIIHERFGWMLAWGDYVWVPFYYTIQTWLILYADPVHENSTAWTIATILTNIAGYTIFRGTNRQKHMFKTNPKGTIWGKPAKIIETPRGNLLISGWWGLARHINYLGDLLLAISWGMPAGYRWAYIPYLYFVFMLGLLLHRFARDDIKCQLKYGEYWEKYKKAVPYRIIPGLF